MVHHPLWARDLARTTWKAAISIAVDRTCGVPLATLPLTVRLRAPVSGIYHAGLEFEGE
jgi:hypothetical protein